MKEIQRKDYLQRLNELKDRHFIKVLTGIRRSGKSTILKQFIHQLKTKYVIDSNQIINYDFNNVNLKKYTYKKLYDEIINKSSKNTTNYVFLDEIQEVKNFEKCVIALFENKQIKFDIYITGSNSHMFSSKLATLFTGRNAPIYVYPITFKSFFKELNKSTDRSKSFEKYLKYGGLGIVIPNYDNEKMLQQTLNWVFSDTVDKDIKNRHRIRNSDGYDKLLDFIFEHVGKKINAKKIEQYLKSAKEPSSTDKTIINYLTWMQESLILHRIKYFDTKGKSILKTKNKYYAGDLGLLSARTTFNIHDKYSYRLENLIFLELKRRGYEVYTYEDDRNEREIDFIAKQGKELTYYQVATVLTDENYERESRILLKQKDGFQKCIICLENNTSLNNDGIKIINLYEWLLEEYK